MTKITNHMMTTGRKPNDCVQHWEVDYLNEVFTPMTFQERIQNLYQYFCEEDVMMTTSFGTKSVFMLYWVSQLRPSQAIHFLDTTYHFPETLQYRDDLTKQFNLNMITLTPEKEKNERSRNESWWTTNTPRCCYTNKIQPLEPVKAAHKVWMSGLMSYQTEFRSNLKIFEQQGNMLKFHPIIDLDEGEFLYYMDMFDLPRHPLEALGYGSIGCIHCTEHGSGREGRWKSSDKTECGLHPDFFLNKKK